MKYDFGTINERDMDMLFLNAFCSEKDFLQLFINKTDFPKTDYNIKEIFLSKTDKDGESDITVIISSEDGRYGLLIEDKIDAIAMPEQPERYIKRGETGIKNKDYDYFCSFIVCPKKYYDNNEAAKKYQCVVFYEEIMDYLEGNKEVSGQMHYQQICQAIQKAKRPPKVEINENANRFFRKYKDYQESNYPELNLRTKRESNGYWAHYTTRFGSVYLYSNLMKGLNPIRPRIHEVSPKRLF